MEKACSLDLQRTARIAAAIPLKLLQVEGFVFGITLEAAIQRMAGIADRHIPNERIREKIDEGRHAECRHGVNGQTACEEIDTGSNSGRDNYQSQLPVKIFLDIKRVMTAGYTGGNDTAIEDGGIHENFNRLLAMGTRHPVRL